MAPPNNESPEDSLTCASRQPAIRPSSSATTYCHHGGATYLHSVLPTIQVSDSSPHGRRRVPWPADTTPGRRRAAPAGPCPSTVQALKHGCGLTATAPGSPAHHRPFPAYPPDRGRHPVQRLLDGTERGNQRLRVHPARHLHDSRHGIRPMQMAHMIQRRDALDLITGNALQCDNRRAEQGFGLVTAAVHRDDGRGRYGRLNGSGIAVARFPRRTVDGSIELRYVGCAAGRLHRGIVGHAGHPTVVDAMYVLAVAGLVQQIGNLSPCGRSEPGGRIKSQPRCQNERPLPRTRMRQKSHIRSPSLTRPSTSMMSRSSVRDAQCCSRVRP